MSLTIFTVTLLTTPEATTEHADTVRAAIKAAVAPLDANPLIEVDEHHDA